MAREIKYLGLPVKVDPSIDTNAMYLAPPKPLVVKLKAGELVPDGILAAILAKSLKPMIEPLIKFSEEAGKVSALLGTVVKKVGHEGHIGGSFDYLGTSTYTKLSKLYSAVHWPCKSKPCPKGLLAMVMLWPAVDETKHPSIFLSRAKDVSSLFGEASFSFTESTYAWKTEVTYADGSRELLFGGARAQLDMLIDLFLSTAFALDELKFEDPN